MPIALHAYRNHDQALLLTLWLNDAPPKDGQRSEELDLSCSMSRFTEPVLIDLLTGTARLIPETLRRGAGDFCQLPVPDYPVVIAERRTLTVIPD